MRFLALALMLCVAAAQAPAQVSPFFDWTHDYDSSLAERVLAALPKARTYAPADSEHCFEVIAWALDLAGVIGYYDDPDWHAIDRGRDDLAAYFDGLILDPAMQQKLGYHYVDPPPAYDELRRGSIIVWGPGREATDPPSIPGACPDPFHPVAGHIAFVATDRSAHPMWVSQEPEAKPIYRDQEWEEPLGAKWPFRDEIGRVTMMPCVAVFEPR